MTRRTLIIRIAVAALVIYGLGFSCLALDVYAARHDPCALDHDLKNC